MLENYKDAQSVFDRLEAVNNQIKELAEEKAQLMQDFYDNYKDFEFPVELEGKQKYFRVYEVEGRFVYNTKFDFGVRVKPVKIFEGS